jgi:hypothetical protein
MLLAPNQNKILCNVLTLILTAGGGPKEPFLKKTEITPGQLMLNILIKIKKSSQHLSATFLLLKQ